jgi:hypothetical protein
VTLIHGKTQAATAIAVAAIFLFASPPSNAAGTISIDWETDGDARVSVVVRGLPSSALQDATAASDPEKFWQRRFPVYASQGSIQADLEIPSMLGRYTATDDGVRFIPAYALARGVPYRAELRLPDDPSKIHAATFSLPAEPRVSSASVLNVYPSADVLPENLLKFYVHFSAPMSRGHIYDHIHLLDESAHPIELPFLEIDEELWNAPMTRLTLFIDPGRLKRGVKPLEDIGPALEAGHKFTLVIDRAWRDAKGTSLVEGFEKPFRVGPKDRMPPNPETWHIEAPKASTRDPLVVDFGEPMDHALTLRLLAVASRGGRLVEGHPTLFDHERRWSFKPARPWNSGTFKLHVPYVIEDLSGNNVGKPFEVDLFEKIETRTTPESASLSFVTE